MTTKVQKNPVWVQKEARQSQNAAKKNADAKRSGIDSVRSGINGGKLSISGKGIRNTLNSSVSNVTVILLLVTMMSSGCNKMPNEFQGTMQNGFQNKHPSREDNFRSNYVQINLVSDTAGFHAARVDMTMPNAWGLAINPNGIFWINANGNDVSEVFDRNGVPRRPPVSVPSPSGIVFNGTTDFIIQATNEVSKFIFASEDGKIYAWASGDSARTVVNRSSFNAIYKGIELANDGGGNYLFATDFHNGKIDVFDNSFNIVYSKPFTDPTIPVGFAPFNIRLIDNLLYVTYAKQLAPENKDDEKGPGNGYVDVFNTDGSFWKRFVSQGNLNSPWGIEETPQGFGQGKDLILIGNFGDGHINVYREDGESRGQLERYGKPITIDGLWAITFPDKRVPGDNPDKLYFTAGPNEESHGLFGYLIKQW